MRVQHWSPAALSVWSLIFAAMAVQATAKSNPPVAVVGNFFDPGNADEATFSPDGKLVALPSGGYRANAVTLWEVASGLPLRTLTHRAFFTASLFAPNGTMMVSGHKDGTIKLWHVETGAVLTTMHSKPRDGRGPEPDPISSLWIDGKGEHLVSGDEAGVATIWTLATRRQLLSVKRPTIDKIGNVPRVLLARLSADGRRLVVLARDTINSIDSVTEYDARSGAEISSFNLPDKQAFVDNGYIGDGAAIVRVSGPNCERGELMLFGVRERAPVASIHKPAVCDSPKDGNAPEPARIFSSPDSTRVVVVPDGEQDLRLWDVATRQLERTIRWPDQAGTPGVIGLSHDLTSVATRETDRVRVRALDTGASRKDFRRFGTPAENVIASKDGMQVLLQREHTEGAEKAIDLDLRKIDALTPTTVRLSPEGEFTVHDFAPAPMLALAGNDEGRILLFSLQAGHEQRKLSVPGLKSVSRARLSPDGKAVLILGEAAKEGDGFVAAVAVLLDAADGKVRQTFEASRHEENVTALAFSPDGATFAIGRRNGSAELWDTTSAQRLKILPIYKDDGDTRTLAFSPDGRFLVGGGLFDDDVFMWNIATAKVVRVFKMGASVAGYRYATAVALSRDGKTVVAGLGQRAVSSGDNGAERGGIVVWDAGTGKLRFTLRGQRGAIVALMFSPDDKWIVSGSRDGTIHYWDRANGKLMATAMTGTAGRWLVLSEGGFYAGSEGSDEAIGVVRGNSALFGVRAREHLFRPELVEHLLRGDPDRRYQDAVRKLDMPALLKSGTP